MGASHSLALESINMDVELKVKNLIVSYLKTIDIESSWRFYKNDDDANGIYVSLKKYSSSIDIIHNEVILVRSETMPAEVFSQIRDDIAFIVENLGFGISFLDMRDPDSDAIDFTHVETARKTNAGCVN
jgi:hypothetical protein